MAQNHHVLAKQAKEFLEEGGSDEKRTILELLQEKDYPYRSAIADVTDSKFADVFRSLVFSFPLREDKENNDYIDFLAQYFPNVLSSCLVNFSQEQNELLTENTLEKIKRRFEDELSINEDLAKRFLDYYTLLLKEQSDSECQLNIDLSCLSPGAIKQYSQQNKADRDKFFNYYLGGFGSDSVF